MVFAIQNISDGVLRILTREDEDVGKAMEALGQRGITRNREVDEVKFSQQLFPTVLACLFEPPSCVDRMAGLWTIASSGRQAGTRGVALKIQYDTLTLSAPAWSYFSS